ncbi:hypothetical protein [Nonomuraea sp. JJY05]|uniref:hypothetical protein n=1 Tax=Nonomuraea sp. JJY05 TaxID=3350255 RepID=UPI00373F1D4A
METVLVASEVAALVPAKDLDYLRDAAITSYTCAACGEAGRVPEQPAAVVLLREGSFSMATLTHRACAPSAVFDIPGLQARIIAEEETTTSRVFSAWLPYPALLLEPVSRVSVGEGDQVHGDRVDGLASWLLGHGLHLVATPAVEPPAAPGWAAELDGLDGLRVLSPTAELIYDGTLGPDESWRAAVTDQGACVLLAGAGLDLHRAPATAEELYARLVAVAAAGRLVGGTVTVRPAGQG